HFTSTNAITIPHVFTLIIREKQRDEYVTQKRNGSAWPREVSKYVWDNYESELKDSGDILYTWQYDIRWAAQQLRYDGILKPVNGRRDLPWELE
ncbi:hypothetical protein, partial [Xenorhabdus bovienii]|uniref:hypothetical protein n=1 Tax=Xenorhabdus bovienii TaxID=40576 RepID=UPI0023B35702